MHDGIIADRYARAFLAYTDAHGISEAVSGQAGPLLSLMGRLPEFRSALASAFGLSFEDRLSLLKAAVNPAPLDGAIERFYSLMDRNGRTELFRIALLDYLTLYRESRGIKMVRVTTACDDGQMAESIGRLASRAFGRKVSVVHKVDPEIIGGFIVESWDSRLDASVRGSLERVGKQLKAKHIRKV